MSRRDHESTEQARPEDVAIVKAPQPCGAYIEQLEDIGRTSLFTDTCPAIGWSASMVVRRASSL